MIKRVFQPGRVATGSPGHVVRFVRPGGTAGHVAVTKADGCGWVLLATEDSPCRL